MVKFNPMNGKLHSETPRTIDNRVLRAILLHHSSADDHIRPVLILTDGSEGFELEPMCIEAHGGGMGEGLLRVVRMIARRQREIGGGERGNFMYLNHNFSFVT